MHTARVFLRVFLVVVVVAGSAGVASAQTTEAGGTVVVDEGETVGDLRVAGGSVIVRGTVEGDLRAYAGTVVIETTGEVTGDLQASAGSVVVRGTVERDLEGAAGSISVTPSGVVGGDVSVAAGDLTVAGTVEGSVKAAVQRIELAETASVAGSVEYSSDAEFVRAEGATVGGQVTPVDNLSVDAGFGDFLEGPLGVLFGFYTIVATLVVGAVLLVAFPESAERVVSQVRENTLRSGGVGLLALVGVPVVLALVAVTIVGLPLALVGLMGYGLAIFVAAPLARYAVGVWILSYTDIDSRWGGLVLGVLGVGLLAQVPFVGWVLDLVVFLFGFGALVRILVGEYRSRRFGRGR